MNDQLKSTSGKFAGNGGSGADFPDIVSIRPASLAFEELEQVIAPTTDLFLKID